MALDAAWAAAWIRGAAAAMADNRERLIDLDRRIGDGDHGENMDRGFAAVVAALDAADAPDTVSGILKTVARTLMSTVGGAAGPLYGMAFLRAAKATPDQPGAALSAADVHAMLEAACTGIQARGKAEPGDKTMGDAWAPAGEAARAAAEAGETAEQALAAAARGAEQGAADTEPLRARKGRASYLGERSIGHLDPGAVSTSLILACAARAAGEAVGS